MKAITFLLGIYLLVLGCLPCADSNDMPAIDKTITAAMPDATDHCHDKESCTPLCICNCCGTPAVQDNRHLCCPGPVSGISKTQYAAPLHQPVAIRPAQRIWQPPRQE